MPDLEFKLQPSKYFLSLVCLFFLGGLGLFAVFIEGWMKYFGFLLVSLYGLYIIWQFGLLKGKASVIYLRSHQAGKKWLVSTSYTAYETELDAFSVVTRWVSLLHFKMPEQQVVSLIFRDSLKAGHYRKLLVRLRVR